MVNIVKIIHALHNKQQVTMLGSLGKKHTSFQLLVATVMSARTKDTTTMPIAERLFKKYKTPKDFAEASEKEIEKAIYGVGFYRTKAKHIKKLSELIINRYDNNVPRKIDELLNLPGVGRKTANCVLCYAFGEPAIPVDIHVHRISNRIGLVKTKTPEDTEQKLMKLVPRKYWIDINETFVVHGQTICLPRKPRCEACPVKKMCEYYKKNY